MNSNKRQYTTTINNRKKGSNCGVSRVIKRKTKIRIYIRDHTIIELSGWVQKMAIFAYYLYIEGGWVRKSLKICLRNI